MPLLRIIFCKYFVSFWYHFVLSVCCTVSNVANIPSSENYTPVDYRDKVSDNCCWFPAMSRVSNYSFQRYGEDLKRFGKIWKWRLQQAMLCTFHFQLRQKGSNSHRAVDNRLFPPTLSLLYFTETSQESVTVEWSTAWLLFPTLPSSWPPVATTTSACNAELQPSSFSL